MAGWQHADVSPECGVGVGEGREERGSANRNGTGTGRRTRGRDGWNAGESVYMCICICRHPDPACPLTLPPPRRTSIVRHLDFECVFGIRDGGALPDARALPVGERDLVDVHLEPAAVAAVLAVDAALARVDARGGEGRDAAGHGVRVDGDRVRVLAALHEDAVVERDEERVRVQLRQDQRPVAGMGGGGRLGRVLWSARATC